MSSNRNDTEPDLSRSELNKKVKKVIKEHIVAHDGLLDDKFAQEAQAANVKNALAGKLNPISRTSGISINSNGCKFISVRCQYRYPGDNYLTNVYVTVEVTDTRHESKDNVSDPNGNNQRLKTKAFAVIGVIVAISIFALLITLLS